jgi:hypothetical protein
MVFWMSGPLRSGLTGTGGMRWFEIGFGLMGLPGLVVGLGLLMAAINMGRQQVLLAVAGDSLAYRTLGPFRTTERRIARAQVRGVDVGPSGMAINDRAVYELHVLLAGRPARIGLLAQRTRAEQEWVAALLRRALGVGRGE